MPYQVTEVGAPGPDAAHRALLALEREPDQPMTGFFAVSIFEDGTIAVDFGGLVEPEIIARALEYARDAAVKATKGGGST